MKFRNFTIVLLCTIFLLPACAKKDDAILRMGYLQSDLHHLPAFVALEKGYFADIKRPRKGGKGFEGVIEKEKGYVNPSEERWR